MTHSPAPRYEPVASDITAALLDLAALTRRAVSAAPTHLDGIADELLSRVLTFTGAQRGALLLPEGPDSSRMDEDEAQIAAVDSAAFRALALSRMQEEEVHALLSAFPADGTHVHASDMNCWITYRLSLSQVEPGDRRAPKQAFGSSSSPSPLAEEGQYALLVLGWSEASDGACALMVARCQKVLPIVADALGSILAGLLLRERMHDLERTSLSESLRGMEPLKAELLGTVSHELRSPLASIKGYAATLLRHERRLGRDERHQFLLAITQASDRLEAIIERLFEVSQLETGQVRMDRAPVDLALLAREAIVALEGRMEAALPGHFTFCLHLTQADGTPCNTVPLIEADQRRLRDVLDNLLENAVTYSPAGGAIDITIRPVVQPSLAARGKVFQRTAEYSSNGQLPRRMLEICVADSGQGIPVDHLQRVFDRFHRVDTSLTRETNGLGLGLTICKRIVDLHGGIIWAENRPHNTGASFFLRFPLDEASGG